MNLEEIKEIIDSWSFKRLESGAPSNIVPRTLAPRIVISPGIVTVILGVRRCGKSTLLRQVAEALGLSSADCISVNFEDPRLANDLNFKLLDGIFDAATSTSAKPFVFFFDEIQNVTGWQKWFHKKLASPGEHRFVITGSNSQLLAGELATSLTGRHISYELFPFDLEEKLLFQKKLGATTSKTSLNDFLLGGGFPASLSFPDPEKLLAQTFSDIIEKDVRERVSAKSSRPLTSLAQMIMESIGSELSLRKLAARTVLSPETVSLYIKALEDAYLIFSCPFFAFSEAKRQRNNKKYYAIDTGLRRAVSTRLGRDEGKDFENFVFLSLRRRTKEIYYWRGKGEVDFVVKTKQGYTPIQVSTAEAQPRHESALIAFHQEFQNATEALLVAPDSIDQLMALDL
jgi:predicted AAA+ superfamily ATPase